MTGYKDHIHAFLLACEDRRKMYEQAQFSLPASYSRIEQKSYLLGARTHMDSLLLGTICKAEEQLQHDDFHLPFTYHSQPEMVARVFLHAMYGEELEMHSMPSYKKLLVDSRSGEESLTRIASRLFPEAAAPKPRTEMEHNAYDRGLWDADKEFIETALPDLIENYAEKFNPREYPFTRGQTANLLPPPRFMM